MSINIGKKIQEEIHNNIFTLFGIDKLPEDKQEETINRIGGIIFKSILLRVLPMLKDEELAEYNKLLDNETDPIVVFDFFLDKIPTFPTIIAEESEKFRKEASEALSS